MPFKKGQVANPSGHQTGKLFLDTLKRAIKQEDAKRIRAAAEKLLDLAAEGEQWAMELLIEKLDGKIPNNLNVEQSVSHRVVPVSEVDSLLRDALGIAEDSVTPKALPH
jgi:hypothetical protein